VTNVRHEAAEMRIRVGYLLANNIKTSRLTQLSVDPRTTKVILWCDLATGTFPSIYVLQCRCITFYKVLAAALLFCTSTSSKGISLLLIRYLLFTLTALYSCFLIAILNVTNFLVVAILNVGKSLLVSTKKVVISGSVTRLYLSNLSPSPLNRKKDDPKYKDDPNYKDDHKYKDDPKYKDDAN
jgi:hypothetical protein